jgi:hypothetical protein
MAKREKTGFYAKLSVGSPDFSKTTIANISSAGVLTNPGVTFFGGALSLGVAKAAVSIGPPMTVPGVSVPLSLWVDGISQFNGIVNIYGAINQFGFKTSFGAKIANSLGIKNGLDVKNALNVGNAVTNFNGKVVVAGSVTSPLFKGVLIGYATGNKPFDLPHWKKKGKRIRHVCAEGPEAGIYIRGKLDGSNVIELPEYWQGLVDYDTITVTLTPYEKKDTSLYVKDVSEDRVLVSGDNHTNIKCFYEVWVSRWIDPRDHNEKLHVVYDGESPNDYPGNNENFLIGGWDYDRRKPTWK